MATIEKEKALDVVRQMVADGQVSQEVAEKYFPELKESEDERIRKSLAAYFSKIKQSDMWDDEFSFGDILAWFEKQGKKDEEILILKDQIESLHAAIKAIKETHRIELEKQGEQKPTDKIEPKFKVGNKIKLAREPKYPARKIIAIQNDAYYFDEVVYLPFNRQDEWELVEQKPAFEMKTPEESLGIDSDTYSKIVDECVYGEQKPVWSEEDGKVTKWVIDYIGNCPNESFDFYGGVGKEAVLSWLNKLKGIKFKDIFQLQSKQEWSEEDRGNLLDIKCIIDEVWHNQDVREEIGHSGEELESLWHWLDKIWQRVEYPQDTWKPTEEQIEYLAKAIATLGDEGDFKTASILNNLRGELKKLREA